MMEENSDIFLGGGDALVYLTRSMHKKYSTTFVWGHPFSTYVSYDLFLNPFCVRDFIDLVLSSPSLTLLVCHSVLLLLYLRNSKIDIFVSRTHHFLAPHSVSTSLPLPFVNVGFKLSVILPFMIADVA